MLAVSHATYAAYAAMLQFITPADFAAVTVSPRRLFFDIALMPLRRHTLIHATPLLMPYDAAAVLFIQRI